MKKTITSSGKSKQVGGKPKKYRFTYEGIHKFMMNEKTFKQAISNVEKAYNVKFEDYDKKDYSDEFAYYIEQNKEKLDSMGNEEMIDHLREFSDKILENIALKKSKPEEYKALQEFKNVFNKLKETGESIKTKSGKEFTGFRWFDKDKDKIEFEKQYDKEVSKQIKHQMSVKETHLDADHTGVFDLKCKDFTRQFLIEAGNHMIEQFKAQAPLFRQRLAYIDKAHVYRFRDRYLTFLVKHNKNDEGYRPPPRDNMWFEVSLKFGNILITGIHISRVKLNKQAKDEGFSSHLQRFYDENIPPTYTEDGLSIFVCGLENGETRFYNFFTLTKSDIDKEKGSGIYSCPHCNTPMKRLESGKRNFYCDVPFCVEGFQKGIKIVYDLEKASLRKQFSVLHMKDIWKIEDKIRNFVTNLIDFINLKEVSQRVHITKEYCDSKNEGRIARGKAPYCPISIVEVDGQLKKYITWLGEKTGRKYHLLRNETAVSGHYYRFWKRSAFNKLYGWIAKCKTDEERREKLKEWLKRDPVSNDILPPHRQYKWDNYYKIIYTWIPPYVKFKGEGTIRDKIHVIKTGDNYE